MEKPSAYFRVSESTGCTFAVFADLLPQDRKLQIVNTISNELSDIFFILIALKEKEPQDDSPRFFVKLCGKFNTAKIVVKCKLQLIKL